MTLRNDLSETDLAVLAINLNAQQHYAQKCQVWFCTLLVLANVVEPDWFRWGCQFLAGVFLFLMALTSLRIRAILKKHTKP